MDPEDKHGCRMGPEDKHGCRMNLEELGKFNDTMIGFEG